MKRILGWLGVGGVGAPDAEEVSGRRITPAQVGEFLRLFPIGTRLRYYPEYQKNSHFDSVILAYRLDGALVYSSHALRLSEAGGRPELHLGTQGAKQRITELGRFHFVVPHSARTELDYSAGVTGASDERLAERPANDFLRGNTITLLSKGANGKVPQIDTTVTRVAVLPDGFYANRRVAFLEPSPETLTLRDQREFPRIYTAVPASLAEAPETDAHACTIRDFSERFLRVDLAAGDPFWEGLADGKRIFVTVGLPHQSRVLVLRAAVHRRDGDHAVLALTGILKDRRFETLDLIDELDLKTSLLHHPATQEFDATGE